MKAAKMPRQPVSAMMPCANQRGDGGDQCKDHHRKRHDTRHFAARIKIADDGQGRDAGTGRAKPLQDAGRPAPVPAIGRCPAPSTRRAYRPRRRR